MTTNQDLHRFTVSRILLCFLSLLLSTLYLGCEGYESVIDDLSQKDANTALVLLRDKNIDAMKQSHQLKKGVTYQIKVKKSKARAALKLLVLNHMPNLERASLKDIYPPGSTGLIPSKSDELARLNMAMQGESEALLRVVPGIVDARVVFSLEAPTDFRTNMPKKTASVALVYQPNLGNLPPLLDQEIKNLIAASSSGLLPEDVIVVQKMLKPIEFIDLTKPPLAINESSPHQSQDRPSIHWWLMILTTLALLVASYGLVRLFLLRRAGANDG